MFTSMVAVVIEKPEGQKQLSRSASHDEREGSMCLCYRWLEAVMMCCWDNSRAEKGAVFTYFAASSDLRHRVGADQSRFEICSRVGGG